VVLGILGVVPQLFILIIAHILVITYGIDGGGIVGIDGTVGDGITIGQ